jgi:hypothetical protein
MSGAYAEVAQVIDAPPEKVYGILSDYRTGHPSILPKPEFESLTVEEGGQGAGTIIRVTMSAFGQKVYYRMFVTEPEPGRVLKEEDPTAGVASTFTVTPEEGGTRSLVKIATEWRRKPGLTGWLESLINPRVARPLYKRELDLLNARVKAE